MQNMGQNRQQEPKKDDPISRLNNIMSNMTMNPNQNQQS